MVRFLSMLPIESVVKSIKNYKQSKGKNPPINHIIAWLELAEREEEKIIMTAWADGWRERDSKPSSLAGVDEQRDYYNSLLVGF